MLNVLHMVTQCNFTVSNTKEFTVINSAIKVISQKRNSHFLH